MRRRTASLLRRLAQRLDPAPKPLSEFKVPEFKISIDPAKSAELGRKLEKILEERVRATGRPLHTPVPRLPDPGRRR